MPSKCCMIQWPRIECHGVHKAYQSRPSLLPNRDLGLCIAPARTGPERLGRISRPSRLPYASIWFLAMLWVCGSDQGRLNRIEQATSSVSNYCYSNVSRLGSLHLLVLRTQPRSGHNTKGKLAAITHGHGVPTQFSLFTLPGDD